MLTNSSAPLTVSHVLIIKITKILQSSAAHELSRSCVSLLKAAFGNDVYGPRTFLAPRTSLDFALQLGAPRLHLHTHTHTKTNDRKLFAAW